MSLKQIKTLLQYSITPRYAFLIALLVFVLDQITKYVIKANISPYRIIEVLPFFNIVYVENIGSAFGMFKSLGNFFFIVIAATAMVFVTVLIIKDKDNRLAFSLILGGAAGNLIDRVIHGYVIDFLDVYLGKYHWPAFNVADSALTIGIILLAVKTVLHKKASN